MCLGTFLHLRYVSGVAQTLLFPYCTNSSCFLWISYHEDVRLSRTSSGFLSLHILVPFSIFLLFYSTAFLANSVVTSFSYGTCFSSSPASFKIFSKSSKLDCSKTRSFFQVSWSW